MIWETEQEQELERRWLDGESATEIGKAMGKSREAISGKVHRLGLKRRPEITEELARVNGVRAAKISAARGFGGFRAATGTVQPPFVARDQAAFTPLMGSTPGSLVERPAGACCWPVDSPQAEQLFCCEPVQDGKSYCRTHQRMSIAKDQPRRLAARDAAWLSGERRRAA